MRTRRVISFICGLLCVPLMYWGGVYANAQSDITELQAEITEKNDRLAEIEKEIAEFEAALQEVGAERSTLQSAINALELERKKVLADVRLTENKIDATDLEIQKLESEISDAETSISSNQAVVAEILRRMDKADEESLVEVFLRQEQISDFWSELQDLQTIRRSMHERITQLETLKNSLETSYAQNEDRKQDLLGLRKQFTDQQSILVSNQATKSELLQQTRNEEAEYQQLLADRKTAREQLLAEVRDIESQIQFILDPNTIPSPGTAVFLWPLDNVIITQRFGYTKFALSGAYQGSQHNGVDMGAAVGTPIKAPLTGTVRNVGNTDSVPGCYSWGQWVLIDHPNGLSSMFAHMSRIGVQPGQKVSTGDIVGYVGNTGYSTGPHLHYTLYVSEGVEVKQFNQFKSVTSCGAALSPFAGIEAYLDPIDYLPAR